MAEQRNYINELMESRGDAFKTAQIILDFNRHVFKTVEGCPELVRSITIARMQGEFEYNLKAAFRSLSSDPLNPDTARIINQGEQVAPKELVEKLERIINSKPKEA